MQHNIFIYIAIMFLVSLALRALPMVLSRNEIKSKFIRSFLYYVPYVTLAVMTFPAILYATDSVWIGMIALILGIVLAAVGIGLFPVSLACCVLVLIMELIHG